MSSHCFRRFFTICRTCETVCGRRIGTRAFRRCTTTWRGSRRACSGFCRNGSGFFSLTFCLNFCTRAFTTFFTAGFGCCIARCRDVGGGMTAFGSNGFRTLCNGGRTWAGWTLRHSCFGNDETNLLTFCSGLERCEGFFSGFSRAKGG